MEQTLKISQQPFYFLRHGETDWNVNKLCQGQKNIPLNEKGRNEAHQAGKQLKRLSIQSICYSSLIRAEETAKIVASYLPNAELFCFSELQERAFGNLEGLSHVYMYEYEEKEDLNEGTPVGNSSVEAKDQFLTRIVQGINVSLNNPLQVLVVSHGRVFQGLCQLLQLKPIKQVPNVKPLSLVPSQGLWTLSYL